MFEIVASIGMIAFIAACFSIASSFRRIASASETLCGLADKYVKNDGHGSEFEQITAASRRPLR